jgi:hypothetical protein
MGDIGLLALKDMVFLQTPSAGSTTHSLCGKGTKTLSDELVALVVDTTRTDEKRFGTILFRPDKPWTHSAFYSPKMALA